jgi:predicted RNA-binding Zn-ribbon protein involved in translation (DUF1610 family)
MMTLLDVYWTPHVNHLRIACDCGATLDHPSRVSLVRCPVCGRAELWHGIEPRPEAGPWSEPVMASAVQS